MADSSDVPVEPAREGDIGWRMRPADWARVRPCEFDEVYEARMARERRFLALQQELISGITGSAEPVVDYYESGLPLGLFAALGGVDVLQDAFVESRVLGEELMKRAEYSLITRGSNGIEDPAQLALFKDYVSDYNQRAFYARFAYLAVVEYLGNKHNLCVLPRERVNGTELEGIVTRANDLVDTLSYSNEYYHYRNRMDPWKELLDKLKRVSLSANPWQDMDGRREGLVAGWSDGSEYTQPGMIVACQAPDENVICRDGKNREKFDNLLGQRVVILFTGYEGLGFPYGRLVWVGNPMLGAGIDRLEIPE